MDLQAIQRVVELLLPPNVCARLELRQCASAERFGLRFGRKENGSLLRSARRLAWSVFRPEAAPRQSATRGPVLNGHSESAQSRYALLL
jgi:hypothetical protein